ncbi:MAG: type 4a pilus biogenesis protein PilO [Phycisphaerae bacterium]|nr:type 4a pilus biogenesis protein PilO [Phycisphaerae bacterium]
MNKMCKREAIFIALLIMVPMLLFLAVIKPRYDSQKDMTQSAKTMSATCDEFQNVRPLAVKRVQNDKVALSKLVEDTQKRLPDESGLGEVLGGLTKMAQDNGVALNDVRPVSRGPDQQAEANEQGYGINWIDIELEGSFEGVYNFLISLEHYPRIVLVDTMTITKVKGHNTEGPPQIDAKLGLVVYHKTAVSEDAE